MPTFTKIRFDHNNLSGSNLYPFFTYCLAMLTELRYGSRARFCETDVMTAGQTDKGNHGNSSGASKNGRKECCVKYVSGQLLRWYQCTTDYETTAVEHRGGRDVFIISLLIQVSLPSILILLFSYNFVINETF